MYHLMKIFEMLFVNRNKNNIDTFNISRFKNKIQQISLISKAKGKLVYYRFIKVD